MPTKKPRIQVPLSQDVYETIRELAEIRGESRAAIIREIVELMAPTLQRTTKVLKGLARQEARLREESEGAVAGLNARAKRSVSEAEQAINPAIEALNLMFDSLEFESTQPPHSNTGVTSQPETSSEAGKSPKVQKLKTDWHGDCMQ